MGKLIILTGLPGSGKSTYAKKRVEEYGENECFILSSDETRFKFTGSAECFDKDKEVFNYLYRKSAELLHQDKIVIFDATNISIKARRKTLSNIEKIRIGKPFTKECVYIATPLEECLKNNKERFEKGGRFVPEEAILNMYKAFNLPTKEEGFDEVINIYNKPEYENDYIEDKDELDL